MTPHRRWSVATLAVLIAGCGPFVEYIPVVPAPRPLEAHPAAQVQAFLVTPPARPHVDIGMLRASTVDGTLDEMIALLRATAGQHGCDAIVLTRVNSPPGSTAASAEGSCEVFTSVSATTPAPPPSTPPP